MFLIKKIEWKKAEVMRLNQKCSGGRHCWPERYGHYLSSWVITVLSWIGAQASISYNNNWNQQKKKKTEEITSAAFELPLSGNLLPHIVQQPTHLHYLDQWGATCNKSDFIKMGGPGLYLRVASIRDNTVPCFPVKGACGWGQILGSIDC